MGVFGYKVFTPSIVTLREPIILVPCVFPDLFKETETEKLFNFVIDVKAGLKRCLCFWVNFI